MPTQKYVKIYSCGNRHAYIYIFTHITSVHFTVPFDACYCIHHRCTARRDILVTYNSSEGGEESAEVGERQSETRIKGHRGVGGTEKRGGGRGKRQARGIERDIEGQGDALSSDARCWSLAVSLALGVFFYMYIFSMEARV